MKLRETLPEVVVVNPDMFVRERHLVDVRDAHLKAIEDKERAEARMFRGRGDRALICDGCLMRSEEHTSELQSLRHLVCRLLLDRKSVV